MAFYVGTRVVVYRRNLEAQFGRTGQGGRWIYRLGLEIEHLAESLAPIRSGDLAGSHETRFLPGANQFQATAQIGNNARHAEWVHRGTADQVGPREIAAGIPSVVNSVSRWSGHAFLKDGYSRKGVRGQKANPWLDKAGVIVSRSRGAIGG